MMPEEVLADTLYGSDDNVETASKMGVDVISPVSGCSKASSLQDFVLSQNGIIITCPEGNSPIKTRKKR